MAVYFIRRIFQSAFLLLGGGLLLYTALLMWVPNRCTPGNRYQALLLGQVAERCSTIEAVNPAAEIQRLQGEYKLDKPWPLNYLLWLFDPGVTETKGYNIAGNIVSTPKGVNINVLGLHIQGSGILTGDFGISEVYAPGTAISQLLSARWVNTLLLLAASLGLALLFGLPLGIISALRQRMPLDHVITFFTLGGLSVPPFVLGLVFIIFFAVVPSALHNQDGWTWMPWLPAGGLGTTGNFWDRIDHLVLPAVTLALPQIAWLAQYTRFAMLDVLQQDFIRTARAKGVARTHVVLRHALRNTLIPVITQLGLLLPALMSGVIVVETVFAYEGLGKVFFRAMGGCFTSVSTFPADPPPCPSRGYWPIDYPLALVLLLFFVLLVSLSSLTADILYAVVDPRVSYAQSKK
jgi:peptide/nickel transport system permease protein